MRLLRALWRIARALGHVLRGLAICAFVFPRIDDDARMAHVGRWSARLLQLLGITVRAHGTPYPGPVLLVANHVSWLDILAINAVHTARFVSKADVHRWPVLGWLIACGGTLFIERERKRDAMRVVHQVAAALGNGDVIAMFPEGTTSNGHGLRAFHANLVQAAVATGTPVQPVALRFSDAHAPISAAAAYIDDMTLLASLWHIVWAERLCVDVTLLMPIETEERDRRSVSQEARQAIAAALQIDADEVLPPLADTT